MKYTIVIDCHDEQHLECLLQEAISAVLTGVEPGTISMCGVGDITLSGEWPKNAVDCPTCCNNAFVLEGED